MSTIAAAMLSCLYKLVSSQHMIEMNGLGWDYMSPLYYYCLTNPTELLDAVVHFAPKQALIRSYPPIIICRFP